MFSDVQNIFCEVAEDVAKTSMESAFLKEIGLTVEKSTDSWQKEGTDIITDVRHGTRKINAFPGVVTLGESQRL